MDVGELDYGGEVIFHVGPHKTGTTTLQHMCSENAAVLAAAGVLYPEAGRRRVGVKEPALLHYHHPLIKDISGGRAARVEAHVEALAAEITRHDPARVVLSSEVLARPDLDARVFEELRRLFGRARRSWLVYLRRQDDLLLSLYCERLKKGSHPWPSTIMDAAADLPLDHRARLARIEDLVRGDRIVVRSYETAKTDLASSFLADIGVYACAGLTPADRRNERASLRLVQMQRLANVLPDRASRPLRRIARRMDAALSSMGLPGGDAASLLDSAARARLLDAFDESNACVERDYFGGSSTGLRRR